MYECNKEQLSILKSRLTQRDIPFKFTPSGRLSELILKNEHPNVKSLPIAYKALFLKGEPVVIQSQMIIDYIEGTLDKKNKWLLDNGEITCVDNSIIIIKENK
jgi:hypothetical protein